MYANAWRSSADPDSRTWDAIARVSSINRSPETASTIRSVCGSKTAATSVSLPQHPLAAIHANRLTGDVGGVGRNEEDHRPRDFLRASQPAQGNRLHELPLTDRKSTRLNSSH